MVIFISLSEIFPSVITDKVMLSSDTCFYNYAIVRSNLTGNNYGADLCGLHSLYTTEWCIKLQVRMSNKMINQSFSPYTILLLIHRNGTLLI